MLPGFDWIGTGEVCGLGGGRSESDDVVEVLPTGLHQHWTIVSLCLENSGLVAMSLS
jgi:hypothetical protein